MGIIARPDRKYILSGFNCSQADRGSDGNKHLSSVQFSSRRLKQAPHYFLTMTHPILLIYFAVLLYYSIRLFYLNYLLYVFFASR